MTIAQGVQKSVRFKRQTGKGSLATNTGGQVLRRRTSRHELMKDTYDSSDEIAGHQQVQSMTHGPKKVSAAIEGLLSPGTYADMLSAVVRRDFAAVTAITGASITIAASGSNFTVSRAAGSYLTDGIKIGMVVRLTGGTFNANNLNKNLLVIAVTALALTVKVLNGLTLTAEGPIASATLSVPGKVTYAPSTGHTTVYYTIEEWFADIAQSERSQDVQYGQAQITLPGTGNATISLSGEGLDQTQATAAYFGSPTAEGTSDPCAGASGALMVNGLPQATITNLQFTINGNVSAIEGVVGTNLRPDIERGIVQVSGSFTAMFEDYTLPTLFTAETEHAILAAITAGTAAAAEFVAIGLPRVKLSSAGAPDDQPKSLKRTYNFTAIYNVTGGTGVQSEKTTCQLQDSLAV